MFKSREEIWCIHYFPVAKYNYKYKNVVELSMIPRSYSYIKLYREHIILKKKPDRPEKTKLVMKHLQIVETQEFLIRDL